MMKEMIAAQNIAFSYAREPIFSHVNFLVGEGDFVALVGANGSGKSTLLRMLLGELEPDRGNISLDGEDVRHKRDWSCVGYMPQSGFQADLSFPATAEEIVRTNLYSRTGLFGFLKSEHREKARDALELTGTGRLAKKRMSELSGGQRQRVLLSKMLVSDPKILLLDEPTSGVDGENVDALLNLLQSLNRDSGKTIFMITHDLTKVVPYASRVFCMEEGSLVELDKEQIYSEMSHKHKHPQNV